MLFLKLIRVHEKIQPDLIVGTPAFVPACFEQRLELPGKHDARMLIALPSSSEEPLA